MPGMPHVISKKNQLLLIEYSFQKWNIPKNS